MKKTAVIALIAIITIPLLNCGKKEKSSDTFIKTASGIEMALIPGGKFIMGGDDKDNSPAREFEISPFYMDRYEVTQGMYKKLELPDASHFKGESNPAEMVAWITVMNGLLKRDSLHVMMKKHGNATFPQTDTDSPQKRSGNTLQEQAQRGNTSSAVTREC